MLLFQSRGIQINVKLIDILGKQMGPPSDIRPTPRYRLKLKHKKVTKPDTWLGRDDVSNRQQEKVEDDLFMLYNVPRYEFRIIVEYSMHHREKVY